MNDDAEIGDADDSRASPEEKLPFAAPLWRITLFYLSLCLLLVLRVFSHLSLGNLSFFASFFFLPLSLRWENEATSRTEMFVPR